MCKITQKFLSLRKVFYAKTMIRRTKCWREAELMLHFELTKIVAEQIDNYRHFAQV